MAREEGGGEASKIGDKDDADIMIIKEEKRGKKEASKKQRRK